MCNFLRRPGDYGGTSPNSYTNTVVINSSVPNVAVSYSTQPKSNNSALIVLRTFINKHDDEMTALEETNPELHALLLRLAYGDSSGF